MIKFVISLMDSILNFTRMKLCPGTTSVQLEIDMYFLNIFGINFQTRNFKWVLASEFEGSTHNTIRKYKYIRGWCECVKENYNIFNFSDLLLN